MAHSYPCPQKVGTGRQNHINELRTSETSLLSWTPHIPTVPATGTGTPCVHCVCSSNVNLHSFSCLLAPQSLNLRLQVNSMRTAAVELTSRPRFSLFDPHSLLDLGNQGNQMNWFPKSCSEHGSTQV
mmetsp:Transcript_41713/g.74855  ORF Transcript_41713/g.74855 Transcript_41713/m.74855 type:complete len:127 (-) Transcript_41713:90-470(-)